MTDDKIILRNALEATIRIGVLLLVAVWCFQIVQPFINLVVWAIIIAIALHPFYGRVNHALGGRRVPAAILVTVVGLVVLLTPTVMLSDTFVEGAQQLAGALQEGRLVIPPPRESLTGWSLIDEPLYRFWSLAAANLGDALKQLAPQLRALSGWLLAAVAGVGLGIIKFVLAMIIAGVLLAHAEGGHRFAYAVFNRLAGDRGTVLAGLAEATVRSVARGILGVAVIQALLAGIGFLAAGVPGAGLWALLCLVLGVVQIGPAPILLGAVVYVFATATTVTAVIFTIWCVFVGIVDNILKPLLLGRGVDVPMAVIFIGTIGGFLMMGFIGLFVGSIVLVLGYTLLRGWLDEGQPHSEDGGGS